MAGRAAAFGLYAERPLGAESELGVHRTRARMTNTARQLRARRRHPRIPRNLRFSETLNRTIAPSVVQRMVFRKPPPEMPRSNNLAADGFS